MDLKIHFEFINQKHSYSAFHFFFFFFPIGYFIGSVNLIPLQNSSSMVSEEIKQMTNEDLATALKNLGVRVGPITGTILF